MTNIQKELFSLQDLKYRDFQSKLMPNIDKNFVIGVRTGEIKNKAKELFESGEYKDFIKSLPHKYYEENNLHAFIIMKIKDYEECVTEVERFLPYIDNWATCDGLRPPVFKKHLPKLLGKIKVWLKSENTYTIRFAIEMLMIHFLDKEFKAEFADLVAGLKKEDYYVNMMIAWYFATALFKKYDNVIGYIENNTLPVWIHNKTIQKAVESCRITEEQKEYLKKLKRK